MSITELFLIAMLIIFTIPYLMADAQDGLLRPACGRADSCRHFAGTRSIRSSLPPLLQICFPHTGIKWHRLVGRMILFGSRVLSSI
jgi:hypothetical protein